MRKYIWVTLFFLLSQKGETQLHDTLKGQIAAERYGIKDDFAGGSFEGAISLALPRKQEGGPLKWHIKLYSGYAFASPGSYRIESNSIVSYTINGVMHDTIFSVQGAHGLGLGFRSGGGIGYSINSFIDIGADVEYQRGTKLKSSLGAMQSEFSYDSTYDEMHYHAMSISPYVVFKALARPAYYLYNRLGIQLTLPFHLYRSGYDNSSSASNWPASPSSDSGLSTLYKLTQEYTSDYKLSLGIGFNVAFGINYRLTPRCRFFAEIFGNFSALYPSTALVHTRSVTSYSRYSESYDFSVDPPRIFYEPNGYEYGYDDTFKTRFIRSGSETSIVDTAYYDPPISYQTGHGKNTRFNIDMNAIGINAGIIYRF